MIDIRCCDNLELMKKIPDNNIDLIYCDILYGTGKKFKYFDDLKRDKTVIKAHYIKRITEMYRILKQTGLIYLQMDYRISHWIRIIMDVVFGFENFRNEIIWHYNTAARKKNDFGNKHDTILRYSKTNNYKFNPIRQPYSPTAPRGYAKEKYYHIDGKVIDDVWNINAIGQNDKTERVGFDTQKPIALVERIIKASTDEGDLVADFYGGSFTTAVACKNLNRNFIGCDINEKAVKIGMERIK